MHIFKNSNKSQEICPSEGHIFKTGYGYLVDDTKSLAKFEHIQSQTKRVRFNNL